MAWYFFPGQIRLRIGVKGGCQSGRKVVSHNFKSFKVDDSIKCIKIRTKKRTENDLYTLYFSYLDLLDSMYFSGFFFKMIHLRKKN